MVSKEAISCINKYNKCRSNGHSCGKNCSECEYNVSAKDFIESLRTVLEYYYAKESWRYILREFE